MVPKILAKKIPQRQKTKGARARSDRAIRENDNVYCEYTDRSVHL